MAGIPVCSKRMMTVASGISEELLDEADDADDVRAAVLTLLRKYLCRPPEAVVDASSVATTEVSTNAHTATASAAPDSVPAPEPATV